MKPAPAKARVSHCISSAEPPVPCETRIVPPIAPSGRHTCARIGRGPSADQLGRSSSWKVTTSLITMTFSGKDGLRKQKVRARRSDAEDQTLPVVRHRRRGGGQVLYVDLP